MEKIYDAIIVGGGPGGASVALYATRGGANVIVLHNASSALHRAERIENYYGSGAIGGAELYEKGLDQIRKLGTEIVQTQVTHVEFDGNVFVATTPERKYRSRLFVMATGASRANAKIPGLGDFEGRGVSYCAVCDAFFYRKRKAAVLGAGEFAEHEYSVLRGVCDDVVLLTNGEEPKFKADKIYTRKISEVYGDNGKIAGAVLDDGTCVPFDGLFIALGVMGSTAITKTLGVMTDTSGVVITDEVGHTNIPGLYAVGDCTAGIKQVGRAVFEGMNVGLDIVKQVKSNVRSDGNL